MATPTPLRRLARPSSFVLGVAIVLGGLLIGGPAAAADGIPSGAVLDQHFDDAVGECGGYGSVVGQSFTVGITGTLAQLHVRSPDASLSLFATRGGLPAGTPLAVVNLVDGVATLPSPLPVVAGIRYAFILPADHQAICGSGTSDRQGSLSQDAHSSALVLDNRIQLDFASYVIPIHAVVAKDLAVTAQTQLLTLVADQTTQTADTYSIVTPASHGTATVEFDNTSIYYRSDPGYTGADSFTYTANTASGPSKPATVSVTVKKQPTQAGSSGSTSSMGQGGSSGSTSSARTTNAPSSAATASGAATTSPTPVASSIATTPTSAGGLNALVVGIIILIVLLIAAAAVLVIMLLRRAGATTP